MARRKLVMAITALAVAGTIAAAAPGAFAETETDSSAGTQCALLADTNEMVCADSMKAAEKELGVASHLLVAEIFALPDYRWSEIDSTKWRIRVWKHNRCSSSTADQEGRGDLYGTRFNNRASSVRTFNGCRIRLYDGRAWTPPRSMFLYRSSNLTNVYNNWNNRMTSFRVS